MATSTTWMTLYLPAATIAILPIPLAANVPLNWSAEPTFPPALILFALFFLTLTVITVGGYTLHNRRKGQLAQKPRPPEPIPLQTWHAAVQPVTPPDRQQSGRSRIRLAPEPQSVIISAPGFGGGDYRRSVRGSIHSAPHHHDAEDDELSPGPSVNPRPQMAPPRPVSSSLYSDTDHPPRTSSLPPMPSPLRPNLIRRIPSQRSEVSRLDEADDERSPDAGSSAVAYGRTSMATTEPSRWNLGFGSMPRDRLSQMNMPRNRLSQISMPSMLDESELNVILPGDPY